jgi:hypothetical protein
VAGSCYPMVSSFTSQAMRTLHLASDQPVEFARVRERPDLTQPPHRTVVNEDVRCVLAARETCEPGTQLGVCGSVEDLKLVARAPEEASGAPGAPGWVADVELYLPLVHRAPHLSLLAALRDRFAERKVRRIAQMRDLLLVHSA